VEWGCAGMSCHSPLDDALMCCLASASGMYTIMAKLLVLPSSCYGPPLMETFSLIHLL